MEADGVVVERDLELGRVLGVRDLAVLRARSVSGSTSVGRTVGRVLCEVDGAYLVDVLEVERRRQRLVGSGREDLSCEDADGSVSINAHARSLRSGGRTIAHRPWHP